MAKAKSPIMGFLGRMSKGQKISLVVLLLLVIVFPAILIVSQLRTNTTPHASEAVSVKPICVGRVKAVISYTNPSTGCGTNSSDKYKSIVFTCNSSNEKITINSSVCTTKAKLLALANGKCRSLCSANTNPIEKETVAPKTPTPTLSKATSACPTVYSPVCATNGKTYSNSCFAKVAGATVKCNTKCPCPTSGTTTDTIKTTPTPTAYSVINIVTATPTPVKAIQQAN